MDIFSYLVDMGQDRYTTDIRTDSVEEVNRMLDEGCSYQLANTGVVLRAPDDWIVDITDISKVNSLSDDYRKVFTFYLTLMDLFEECGPDEFVKSVLKDYPQYDGFVFKVSQSSRIWGEIRIIGSDNRVKTVRQVIYDYVIKTACFNKYYKHVQNVIDYKKFNENKIPIKNISNYERYKDLFSYYENVCGMKFDMFSSIQMEVSEFQGADCFLFSPKSCFDYMFNLTNKFDVVPVSFLEVHAYNVAPSMIKCSENEMKGKKVAIFDKVYSGKTMDILVDYVREKGGIPMKIGVFPKNITKFDMLDYFIFLDKLVPVKKYHSFVDVVKQVMGVDGEDIQESIEKKYRMCEVS